MIRGRLNSSIGNQEFLCPWCYRMAGEDRARPLGGVCSTCGNSMTCEICDVDDCEFRNDLYNTNGDCLMTK